MKGLRGKNVLVTGSTSGIGQAIAVRFGEEGSNVAVNYRSRPDDAAATATMIHSVHQCADQIRGCGGKVALVQADVAKEEDVVRMVRQTVDELGGLDILINNAGIQISKPSHELDMASFDKVLNVPVISRAVARNLSLVDAPDISSQHPSSR